MLRINGKRIYLRDHVIDDLNIMHQWLSDPEVMKFLSFKTKSLNETLVQFTEGIEEQLKTDRKKYYLAIVLRSEDKVIGDCGFTIQNKTSNGGIARIGYFMLKPYWGQGYATEAAKLMIEYCFSVLSLHKVTAGCDKENKASARIMQKCGMNKEAELRKQRYFNGEWRDRLEYAILKDDCEKDI